MSPDPIAGGPRIGIVIPVYGHSGLVSEAIESVRRQTEVSELAAVVVNDGCRYWETGMACIAAAADPSALRLSYVKRPNGGLSAARNTGIEFLLAQYPGLEAIYLLDADNRLEPYATRRFLDALDAIEEADWFYPDIEMFGLENHSRYSGAYSRLIHMSVNICEAGSLIRRRVFDAGVRFDETMRRGYEDWEFWLAAVERGFKGRHLADFGFRYRKRPESMLSEANRDESEIRGYIQHKHKRLYSPVAMTTLEAAEAPRYAFLLDDDSVLLALDPRFPKEQITFAEFAGRYWSWLLNPQENFSPPYLVDTSREVLKVATDAGVLSWLLWDMESRLRDCNIATVELAPSEISGVSIEADVRTSPAATPRAHMGMISAELTRGVVKDSSLGWWNGIVASDPNFSISSRVVQIDQPAVHFLEANSLRGLHRRVADLFHSRYRSALDTEWKWTYSGVPERHTGYKIVRAAVNGGVVRPSVVGAQRHVVLLCSFVDFGGVEKVATNMAATLKSFGFRTHLVLLRVGEVHLPKPLRGAFNSIGWIADDGLLNWMGDDFDGTRLSWWSQHGDKADALGLLSGYDAVINCQSADAHGLVGELKRRGSVTVTHQHILEYSPNGRPGGSAVIAKAFEHSYDRILTGSKGLSDWFLANGVPEEKLSNIANAPSYAMSDAALDQISEERQGRDPAEPLRVLFAARFDAQKGIDRIDALLDRTETAANIEWRIVGKAVVDGGGDSGPFKRKVEIEPPVYDPEDLTDLYQWADVIVLPSRFEGVPLTVIEAMRCGAVMLAANAGGVAEVIRNGVDGLIVEQENCVDDMLAALLSLAGDRAQLRRLSEAAMRVSRSRSWAASLNGFGAWLHEAIDRRSLRLAQPIA